MSEQEIDVKTQITKSDNLGWIHLAERAKQDLFFLDKQVLGCNLMEPATHQDLCWFVESCMHDPMDRSRKLKKSPYKFVAPKEGSSRDIDIFGRNYNSTDLSKKFRLILMPRGSFKTTVVTVGFTLQMILNNPNIRIMIDSEVFDKSRAFLSEIRGHMEGTTAYREIFKALYGMYPDKNKTGDKWSDTELNIAARTRRLKEPTISAAGIGVTKVGMHYDVIIADDLHSEKNVTSKDAIQQVIDHYRFLLSLLEPDGIMIVIGTRWDYNDVYQYILDREKNRFAVYARQAIMPDGSLIFPERLTKEFLENQKISQGSYIFSCQYQNMPVDDETAMFKYSQMQRIDPSLVDSKPINWFLLVDPAISQEKTADYTAMVLAGMDQERNIYVKDILRGRLTPSEIVDNIFRLYEEHKPTMIAIEAIAFQQTLQYAIKDKSKELGWWLPIREIKRRESSKEDRIRRLQPYYEFGHIYHFDTCPNIDDLEYELIHFPRGKTDDMIDALSGVVEVGFSPSHRASGAKSQEDKSRKEWLRKISKPRSKITGV